MKVLASNGGSYGDTISSVIVEVSAQELLQIMGESGGGLLREGMVKQGTVIELSKRYQHALSIEHKSKEATQTAKTLRAFADMLELQHPAITEIAAPPVESEAAP